jgi:hypothetical protein
MAASEGESSRNGSEYTTAWHRAAKVVLTFDRAIQSVWVT